MDDNNDGNDDGDSDTGFRLNRRTALGLTGAALGSLAFGTGPATADMSNEGEDDEMSDNGDRHRYRVTISNLTSGQPLTPPAVAAHKPSVGVFSVGEEANEATTQIAENGNLDPLVELIEETDAIKGSAVGGSPLVPAEDPGDTDMPYYASLELVAEESAGFLSFISMLIATNDGFTGLDTVVLPEEVGQSYSYYAASYDAGTEENTEDFADIVPPAQAFLGVSTDDVGSGMSNDDLAEDGVITPHPGVAGDDDLDPDVYGWDDPAALVHVERLD
jgi:hypothetical protein